MAFIKRHNTEHCAHDERGRNRDCAGYLAELSDPDPAARRWAARDIVGCPDAVTALVEHLKVEPEISVREVILTSLIRLGDPAGVAGLVECLRSEDATLRNEVIETMKQFPDEMAPIVKGLLLDPDSDVRIFAVNILENLRHPAVEELLLSVIENDDHVNVCATALDLLVEVGTEMSLSAIERLKTRFQGEPYIQFAADMALRRIHES